MSETDASAVSLSREALSGTTAKFATLVVGFVGTILFARILGPATFGGYFALLAAVQIVERPTVGWAVAGKKRFSEVAGNQGEILGAQLAFVFGYVALAIGGAALAAPWLRGYTDLDHAAVLFGILLLALSLYLSTRILAEARGLVGGVTWTGTLRDWLAFVLQLGLVLLGLGAVGMAVGYAVAAVCVLPVLLYYVRARPKIPSRGTIESLWTYARFSIPETFLGTVYSRFDIILLTVLLSPAAAGYYEVAFRVSMPAAFVYDVTSRLLMPRVSNLASKDESIATDVGNTLAFSSVLAIPLFAGAVLLADEVVVTLYGPEYRAAAVLLIGLCLYRVVRSQSQPLAKVVDGLDRPDFTMWLSLVTLAFNVALGVVLVLRMGAIGVVVATVAAEFLRYVALLAWLRTHLPRRALAPRAVFHQWFAALAMGAVVWTSLQLVAVDSWVALGAVVGLGGLVYAATLYAASRQLRETIAAVLDESETGGRIVERFPGR